MSDEELIEELRDMGEHPSRADLPMGRTLRDAADRFEALQARVEALEARLEIEPSHPYVGIDARDATIRLLEQRIEALETEKRKLALDLLAALGQAADALEGSGNG